MLVPKKSLVLKRKKPTCTTDCPVSSLFIFTNVYWKEKYF